MYSIWKSALDTMLRSLFQRGSLAVVLPDGSKTIYGDASGAPLTVRLHDKATIRHLVLNPELALGESYMNERLTIEGDDIQGFLALVNRNIGWASGTPVWWQKPLTGLRRNLRAVMHNNVTQRARRNVAHHYDLSGRLYDLFLDEDRQYSCAYFKTPDATLEQAQTDKKAHIARKLLIEPGMDVLDIGCGWGGMALTLARDHGANVTGITLSREQFDHATRRAQQEGLSDRVTIKLCDYREIGGNFDRIVSVGMFEHVGLRHADSYFRTIHDRLTPDGIALVHTIGRTAPAAATNPWIAKYIFPGGYIPTLSEAARAIEKANLWPADVECWRLHYAYTLRQWFERFESNAQELRTIYDERFIRMWRFYLAASEQTFRHGPQAVYQFQLSRKIDAVPLVRDYLYAAPEHETKRRIAHETANGSA